MAGKWKTLIIAVDNSKECLKAIDFAKEHFPTGYAYHLLHVQTYAASSPLANADIAAIAYYGQEAWDQQRREATDDLFKQVFIPRASEAGATVRATTLESDFDGSSAVGAAICNFVEKEDPTALILMKQNKPALARFFMGSVTKHCATKCHTPVIVVPT